MEQPLHLYQASAGSGKTFNIARQFLKLCLRNPESKSYRRILAITFTNKATAEMKSRFLKELRVLAHGLTSAHLEELMKWHKLSEAEIRQNARKVLRAILHDYHHLSVMTIDSFFQRILRAFAHDMKLSGNFETELQQSVVTEFAVQELIERSSNEPKVFSQLLQLLETRMEEGDHWNFRESLRRFAAELMREDVDLVNRPEDFEQRIELIKQQERTLIIEQKEALEPHAAAVRKLWERYHLNDCEFYQKKRGIKLFLEQVVAGQLPTTINSFIEQALDSDATIEVWIKPGNHGFSNAEAAAKNGLINHSRTIKEIQEQYEVALSTYRQILHQAAELKFLPLLAEALRAFPRKTGLLPQSDVARLIHQLISQNDSSFLLERAGTLYRHYLLDEFQDTSRLQWENLRPLLAESVSNGNFSMAVGDVKQAIYRWRNGDWRLLGGQLQTYFEDQYRSLSLQVNFRSQPAIIHFNNLLFPKLAAAFYQELKTHAGNSSLPKEATQAFQHFYSEKEMNQLLPDKKKGEKGGFVQFTLAEKDIASPLDWVVEQVKAAQKAGFQAGDIAVLVRKNSQAAAAALHLLHQQTIETDENMRWAVLTEEALRLNQSNEVRAIIATCRMLHANQNHKPDDLSELELAFCLSKDPELWQAPSALDFTELKAAFKTWSNLQMPDLIAVIITHLNLNQHAGAHPYLMMFEEEVRGLASRLKGEIRELLHWWDEQGANTKVLTATASNAIRIMTIHQSKGLEFPVVLLPFMEEKLDDTSGLKATNLWEDVSLITGVNTGTLPLKYSSELGKTQFSPIYLLEKTMRFMDLLNLIYVAFTRPCNWLCGYATMPAITKEEVRTKGNWINHLEMLMPNLGLELTETSTDTVRTFQFGDPYGSKESEKAPTLILSLKDYPLFRLPELHLPEIAQTSEQKGRLLHDFLARLQKPHHAMMELESWPVYKTLSSETQKSLQQQLSNLLGMPEFLELYEDALQVFSERDFFSPEGLLRPDRVVVRSEYAVVVDFKTGTVRPEHEQQVRRYGQYLTQMLQKPVKGLILYSANATSISLS